MTKKNGDKSKQMRSYAIPKKGEKVELGPLSLLKGKWVAKNTGWNMIALPFKDAPDGFNSFRILMNQYKEELNFSFVDDKVPNRGLMVDQEVATLDYQQSIKQLAAEDFPPSDVAGPPGLAIHHEPGLWIHVKNHHTADIDVARLATIPHGNSVLALGKSEVHSDMPEIPKVNGLPFGRFEDLETDEYDFKTDPYLLPYKYFIDKPFRGTVPDTDTEFPGFNPRDMTQILRFANKGLKFKNTTTLTVDTELQDGGISNMPFVVKEAHPVSMRSTFWIQELSKKSAKGKSSKLRLQYLQIVTLNFFAREDQQPGRAQWPHVSICTLDKVED